MRPNEELDPEWDLRERVVEMEIVTIVPLAEMAYEEIEDLRRRMLDGEPCAYSLEEIDKELDYLRDFGC